MNIHSDTKAAFQDRFSGILDAEGQVIEDLKPVDWQDDIFEIADSLVPIFTADIVSEWVAAGYPEVDDPGIIEGVTDVSRIMAIAVYETYTAELYELADEAGFNS